MTKKPLKKKDNETQQPNELSIKNTISEKSENTFTYDRIRLEQIHVEGQSVRDAVDDDHVIELSMSMAKNGLLEPIVLQIKAPGNYQLIAGFHRLTAAHRLQWASIPAHIMKSGAANIKALALIENVVRKSMSLKEECDAVSHLAENEKLSISQMCDLLGKGRTWIERRLMALNIQEDLKEPLFEGLISVGFAEELARVEDESQRKWLTSWTIQNRPPKSALQAMVDQTINNPSIQSAVEIGNETAQEIQKAPQFLRSCGACGTQRDITEITCVWVCKNGCPPPKQQEEIK